MRTRTARDIYSMVITAMLLAVGLVLPFLTGQIQAIARTISPLHIPVLICGLCCGWKWGLGLGIILPLLRGLIFGMPVFPTSALPMAFELGAYGLLTGLLYKAFLKAVSGRSRASADTQGSGNTRGGKGHLPLILAALIISMIIGRFVGGAAKAVLLSLGVIGSGSPFTFAAFFSSYFVSTAVGAVIHIILVPAVVLALEKAGLSPLAKEAA